MHFRDSGIIYGPFWGSFSVHFWDHLRSILGIIYGPFWASFTVHFGVHLRFILGIIYGPFWGSFSVHFGDHLRSILGFIYGPFWGSFTVHFGVHFRSGINCGTVQFTSASFQYIIKQLRNRSSKGTKEISLEFSVDIKEDHFGSTVLKNKTRGFFLTNSNEHLSLGLKG